jgi:hypothetical protein
MGDNRKMCVIKSKYDPSKNTPVFWYEESGESNEIEDSVRGEMVDLFYSATGLTKSTTLPIQSIERVYTNMVEIDDDHRVFIPPSAIKAS